MQMAYVATIAAGGEAAEQRPRGIQGNDDRHKAWCAQCVGLSGPASAHQDEPVESQSKVHRTMIPVIVRGFQ